MIQEIVVWQSITFLKRNVVPLGYPDVTRACDVNSGLDVKKAVCKI